MCAFEAFQYVSRKVFVLLPFACGCPVWLYPVRCSREIQLQMLSNPSFPVHHQAGVLLEWCGPPTVGHRDFTHPVVKLVIIPLRTRREGRI